MFEYLCASATVLSGIESKQPSFFLLNSPVTSHVQHSRRDPCTGKTTQNWLPPRSRSTRFEVILVGCCLAFVLEDRGIVVTSCVNQMVSSFQRWHVKQHHYQSLTNETAATRADLHIIMRIRTLTACSHDQPVNHNTCRREGPVCSTYLFETCRYGARLACLSSQCSRRDQLQNSGATFTRRR